MQSSAFRRSLLALAVAAVVCTSILAADPAGASVPGAPTPPQVATAPHAAVGPAALSQAFSDVPASHPFKSAIAWLVTFGITDGYPDGTYKPTAPVTRQSIAAFLYRYAGFPDGSHPTCTSAPFLDVPETHPFCGEIQWMVDEGIANGYPDGGFHPSSAVTRQSLAVFLWSMAHPGPTVVVSCAVAPFPDVPASHSFCPVITWMVEQGITSGYPDGGFHPTDPVTRQSAAALILRDFGRTHLVEVQQVDSSASGSSCAVRKPGKVSCWGANDGGQLGDGTKVQRDAAVTVPGISDATQVAVGSRSTCALRQAGTVVCWGQGEVGQLGDGLETEHLVPTTIPGLSGVVEIDMGGASGCARLGSGQVRCWGLNTSGQVGDGTTTGRPAPVSVAGITDATSLGVGTNFACVRRSGGTVSCWGGNGVGQLGDGTNNQRNSPVQALGLTGAVSVSIGMSHSCALLSAGQVRCWGWNSDGQLGDTTKSDLWVPSPVVLSGALSIAAGAYNTCAVVADGGAKCWGDNDYGQNGAGAKTDRTTPIDVLGVIDVTRIVVGSSASCAIMIGDAVWCWGANSSGQLGIGTPSVQHDLDTAVERIS